MGIDNNVKQKKDTVYGFLRNPYTLLGGVLHDPKGYLPIRT